MGVGSIYSTQNQWHSFVSLLPVTNLWYILKEDEKVPGNGEVIKTWSDMYDLTCMIWHAWSDMHDLTCMIWHVLSDMYYLTCMIWHVWSDTWSDMHDLTCMIWHVWSDMYYLTCIIWHVWSDMYDLTCMIWHVWSDMYDLTCMIWHVWSDRCATSWEKSKYGHCAVLSTGWNLVYLAYDPQATLPWKSHQCMWIYVQNKLLQMILNTSRYNLVLNLLYKK